MGMLRGFFVAAAFFVSSFVLHIIAGANDLGWLFMIAVVLIFFAATGFAAVSYLASTKTAQVLFGRILLAVGGVAGATLTASALWAANDRTFAWWQPIAGLAATVVVSSAVLVLAGKRPDRIWRGNMASKIAGRAVKKATSLR